MNRFLFGLGLILILTGGILRSSAIPEYRTIHEPVYMSRHCENGWYIEDRDGDKLTMACNEYE